MPTQKKLKFDSPRLFGLLYCNRPQNLEKAETAFRVKLETQEDGLLIAGAAADTENAAAFFELLGAARSQGLSVTQTDYDHTLSAVLRGEADALREIYRDPLVLRFKRASIVPKTLNQKRYLRFIQKNDVVFGIGPAGTGKTYLAVAAAVAALQAGDVEKIVLTRPAVEAGEALGFLPGDL